MRGWSVGEVMLFIFLFFSVFFGWIDENGFWCPVVFLLIGWIPFFQKKILSIRGFFLFHSHTDGVLQKL